MVRVARPGAVLIVGCDARYGFVRWLVTSGQMQEANVVHETGEYEAGEGAYVHLYTVAELTQLLTEAGCEILETASTPILVDTWEQNSSSTEQWEMLKMPELKVCQVPELLGMGHHLFCVARQD